MTDDLNFFKFVQDNLTQKVEDYIDALEILAGFIFYIIMSAIISLLVGFLWIILIPFFFIGGIIYFILKFKKVE